MPSTLGMRMLFVVVLALLLNLQGLGRQELQSEEGRRLLPARSLLDGEADPIVPRIWGRAYIAKPPLFYAAVATVARIESIFTDDASVHSRYSHNVRRAEREIALQRLLDALPLPERLSFLQRIERRAASRYLNVNNQALQRGNALAELDGLLLDIEPTPLPPVTPVSPLAARWTALLGSILCALALVVCGRSMQSGVGLLAACLFLCLPVVLEKSTLGELESTFTALCFAGTALAWSGLERRSTSYSIAGGAVLGLATLTKGPFALLFSLPALVAWAWTRSDRRSALVRTLVVAVLATLPFLFWYVLLAASTGEGDAILSRWKAEAGRGGTGGMAHFLQDRWRLFQGVLFGWAPASLLLIAAWRARSTRAWRDISQVRFAGLVLIIGLCLLCFWPGVRARYALPLAPWAALLGGSLLASATKLGERQPWRPFGERAARGIGAFLALFTILVALVLSIELLIGPDAIFPSQRLNAGHLVFSILLAIVANVLHTRRETLAPGTWLAIALLFAVGLRWLERSVIEAGTIDQKERAAGAMWLVDAIDRAGGGPVSIDAWTSFNLLAYTGERLEWTDEPEELATGALCLRAHDPNQPQTDGWRVLFPPPDGLGNEAWRRIPDLRALVLVQRVDGDGSSPERDQ